MADKGLSLDYRRLLEMAPGAFVVILPDMTIAAATNEYLNLTMRKREEIIGRHVFEAFPDNPEDDTLNSEAVQASFEKVFETGEPDELPVQKYDVERPKEEGGGFEERYWRIITYPGFDENGQVAYIYPLVRNITEQVKAEQKNVERERQFAELEVRAERSESEHRETAEELEDMRRRLEAALDAREIGTWMWDPIKDKVVADKNLAKFFSVSKKDAKGSNIRKYMNAIHPEDLPKVEKLIAEALEKKDAYESEYRLVNPDGSIRWVIARGRVLRDDEGRAIQMPGIVIDTTETKRIQKQLFERTTLATLSSDVGISVNFPNDLPILLKYCTDALVEHIGVAFARIWTLDKSGSVLKLQASSGLYTHTDGPHSRIPVGKYKIGKIAEERKPHLTNEVLSDPRISDKEWAKREGMIAFAGYPLIVEKKIVGVIGAFSKKHLTDAALQSMEAVANTIANTIERKHTEQDLSESIERFHLVTRATNDAIRDWDLVTDEMWWSDAIQTIFGFKSEQVELKSTWWYRHIHPEDRKRVMAGINKVIDEGEEHWSDEYRFACSDSNYKYILDRGFVIHRDGKPERMIAAMQDVTESKLIESEREKLLVREKNARTEAEKANRMKDEFLATLSHELRTPLSSILGWSRLLKQGQVKEDQMERAIETIERNAKVQSQLIEDVLDVSRIISGKMRMKTQPIDLSKIIESAIDSVSPAAKAKNIDIQCVTDADVLISGDADRLQQIIWNLLSNAIKFTSRGGSVQVNVTRLNSHVELIVRDDGIGIEPETIPFIFDRFRQSDSSTKRKHGGLGLGLAIVRHLVELHGGTVKVLSDGLNKGTEFTVTFPVIALQSEEIHKTEDAKINLTAGDETVFECPPEIKDLRILIVDDEQDTLDLLIYILETCGGITKGVASVEEAFAAIEKETFDVLVSDVGMPERDGYDLIKGVRKLPREQNGRIPAVALTAYARSEDRMRLLSSGFHMHVSKPVDPAELLAVVASLSNRDKS